MTPTLHGEIRRPVVAVVGTWDPLHADQCQLIDQLCRYAGEHRLSSVVVLIHPAPPTFMYGEAECPEYHDLDTRIDLLRARGVDGVLHLLFGPPDLSASAADFLKTVRDSTEIEELWLGAKQTLGRGPAGSQQAASRLAESHHIRLRVLPPRGRPAAPVVDVCACLKSGRIAAASLGVGRPPVRARPPSGALQMAWCPGVYGVVPLASPEARIEGVPRAIVLTPTETGMSRTNWPDADIPWLAFVSGPGDHVTEAPKPEPPLASRDLKGGDEERDQATRTTPPTINPTSRGRLVMTERLGPAGAEPHGPLSIRQFQQQRKMIERVVSLMQADPEFAGKAKHDPVHTLKAAGVSEAMTFDFLRDEGEDLSRVPSLGLRNECSYSCTFSTFGCIITCWWSLL